MALVLAGIFLLGRFSLYSFTVRGGVALVAVSFGLAGAYAAALRSGKYLARWAELQLILDQLTWTGVAYLTGGAASGATSFYGLTCVMGAVYTGLRGASVAAVSGALSLVGLALSLQYGYLKPPPDQPIGLYRLASDEIIYYVAINLLMLTVVTLLGGYLAERLRIAGGRLVVAEARAERAEQLAALGRLAAGLAHEIRNPLSSIAGSIQLLRGSSKLSEEDKVLCEIVQRETGRLDDLVSDMVNFARPRDLELSDVDVARLSQEVVQLASQSGRAVEDVRLVYRGLETATIRGDNDLLRQMVWNLVRNAVQASGAGEEVTVAVEFSAEDELILSVSDHGPGISEEARARLFDAFFTTRTKGTGIGLAVVKRIVDQHGFSIEVQSTETKGAAFRVKLGKTLDSV